MNSLRHGFAASRVVLSSEDLTQFHAMRDNFMQIHQPANDVECCLVDEMVVANWRLFRMWAAEASVVDRKIRAQFPDSSPPPELDLIDRFGQVFEIFADRENALKLMTRYEANCRWQYDRALRNLDSLRKSAAGQPEPQRPVIPPGTAVKIFYCPKKKDGECSDSTRHELCPRQEPCPVEPADQTTPRPL